MRNSYANGDTNAYGDPNSYPNADTDTNAYRDPNSYPDADTDTYRDPNSDTHTNAYRDPNSYRYANGDTNAYGDPNSYPNADTHTNAYRDANSNALMLAMKMSFSYRGEYWQWCTASRRNIYCDRIFFVAKRNLILICRQVIGIGNA